MRQFEAVPDFIPEDIQAAYLHEVRGRTTDAPEAATTDPPAARKDRQQRLTRRRAGYLAAALLGFLGVFAVTALWGWLAVSTSDPVWWGLFLTGAALTVVGALTVGRLAVDTMRVLVRPVAATPR